MPVATEIEPLATGLWIWRVYDPAVKADLFSTSLATSAGIYLIDPVLLAPHAIAELTKLGSIAGIVVTNENHHRAATKFADQFQVPIHENTFKGEGLIGIPIEGAPAGEL